MHINFATKSIAFDNLTTAVAIGLLIGILAAICFDMMVDAALKITSALKQNLESNKADLGEDRDD